MNDRSAATDPVELAREPDFRLGAAQVCPVTREIAWPGGRTESVEPRVMQLLVALHRAGGGVVTRDDLTASCWDGVVVGEDAINRTLGRLRRLSEIDDGASFRIETLPRVGYRLIAVEPQAAAHLSARRRRWPWLAVGVALALVALAGAVVLARRGPVGSDPETSPPLIAVQPFESPGGGPRDQVAAEALAVTLGDSLSRTGLRLISPSSSFRFRGAAKAGAGRTLGAQYVIDGALQREGERLTLTLRMESVARGVTVWSSRLEEAGGDAGRLQDRAAAAVGAAIAWPAAARVMKTGEGLDADAVALFLQSTEADRRGAYAEAFTTARRLIARAPDAPMAQANLAIVTADVLPVLPQVERAQALADARRAADRVAQREPRLGEGFVAQALLLPRVRWADREALFGKAIAADADNGAAHIYYAAFLQDAGRLRDTLAVLQRAEATDRFSTSVLDREALALALTGRGDAADRLLDRGEAGWPDRADFAAARMRIAVVRGRAGAARTLLDDPTAGPLFLDRGYGQPLRLLVQALEQPDAGRVHAAAQACLAPDLAAYARRLCLLGLAAVGDLDSAFRLADRLYPGAAGGGAADQERAWLVNPERAGGLYVLYAPGLRAWRAHPRAAEVFRRLGLSAYWRASGRPPDFCASEAAPVCATLTPRG